MNAFYQTVLKVYEWEQSGVNYLLNILLVSQ